MTPANELAMHLGPLYHAISNDNINAVLEAATLAELGWALAFFLRMALGRIG